MERHDHPTSDFDGAEIHPYAAPAVVPGDAFSAEGVQPRPWGFWMTSLWFVAIGIVWLVTQTGVVVMYMIGSAAANDGRMQLDEASLTSDGLLLGIVTLVCMPVMFGICALASALCGWRVSDYLALRGFKMRDLALGLLCLGAYIVASDGLSLALGRPIVPPFMDSVWESARFLPLLVAALVIGAPIAEEVVFRGFLMQGYAASWLRPVGAVVVTSAAWAVIHLQYDAFAIGQIFFGGLLLGWLRLRSGSTLLAIVLHSLMNVVATVQVAVL